MNPWTIAALNKKTYKVKNAKISLYFEKGIDTEIRTLFIDFTKWLRKTYLFPINVNVYIKNCEKIRLLCGREAYGSFRWFKIRNPYIRIPAKPESKLFDEFSKDEIIEQILSSLVHELTHYYQWAFDFKQTNASSEWQANYYRYRIIDLYMEQCDLNKD